MNGHLPQGTAPTRACRTPGPPAPQIPPHASSCVAPAVIPASYARCTRRRGFATVLTAGCRGQPGRRARAAQAPEPAAALCRGRATGGYRAPPPPGHPAVREPVNATDIGELTPRHAPAQGRHDLPARCRRCERPTRLESHAPLPNIATACVPDPPIWRGDRDLAGASVAVQSGVFCARAGRHGAGEGPVYVFGTSGSDGPGRAGPAGRPPRLSRWRICLPKA